LTLSHWSTKPLPPLRDVEQDTDGVFAYFKPRGLWVSIDGDDDWRAFCEGNEFNLDAFIYRTIVRMKPDANILTMGTVEELNRFTDKYYKDRFAHIPDWPPDSSRRMCMHLDWPRIAKEYDGIIIAPYVWPARMDLMWYYTWDCASGCIWKASAIESVECAPVPEEDKPKKRARE
jgi:hypothetical protein